PSPSASFDSFGAGARISLAGLFSYSRGDASQRGGNVGRSIPASTLPEPKQAMSGLVPKETFALVGELLDEPMTSTITAKESQRFALATGDPNPIYFDESSARAAGYRGIVDRKST